MPTTQREWNQWFFDKLDAGEIVDKRVLVRKVDNTI